MFSTFETNAKSAQKCRECATWVGEHTCRAMGGEPHYSKRKWYIRCERSAYHPLCRWWWCSKTLWCRQLFSWFFIVDISVICSYQMHAATIEHRKNSHNNHKSERIKETKVAGYCKNASINLCTNSIWFACLFHKITHWLYTPHTYWTMCMCRETDMHVHVSTQTHVHSINIRCTCSIYIGFLLVFCSFSVRAQ